MNLNSILQNRKYFEKQIVQIATRFGHMRGIDEENVVRPQLLKGFETYILHFMTQHFRPRSIRVLEQAEKKLRIWIDESEIDCAIEEHVIDVEHRAGGKARADLYNPSRLQVTHHAVENDGVGVGKIDVLKVVPSSRRLFR